MQSTKGYSTRQSRSRESFETKWRGKGLINDDSDEKLKTYLAGVSVESIVSPQLLNTNPRNHSQCHGENRTKDTNDHESLEASSGWPVRCN